MNAKLFRLAVELYGFMANKREFADHARILSEPHSILQFKITDVVNF